MTDDDDTVLDNASVNSQDQDYTSGDRRQADRRRRRRRQRGTGRGNGSAASGTETDGSVSGYRGYRGSAPPRSTSQGTGAPVNQSSASKSDNQRQSPPAPGQTAPSTNRPPASQSRSEANKSLSASASAIAPKEKRDRPERPTSQNMPKSLQNAVRNGQTGSESDSKGKKGQDSSSVKKEQLVNGE